MRLSAVQAHDSPCLPDRVVLDLAHDLQGIRHGTVGAHDEPAHYWGPSPLPRRVIPWVQRS